MTNTAAVLVRVARICLVTTALSCCGLAQSVNLSLTSSNGSPGAPVSLDISLASTGNQPASLQWDIGYSTTDFSSMTVAAANGLGKTLNCQYSAGEAMCLLWGLNNTTLPNGVIATVTLTVSPSTQSTTSQVQLINGTSASATGTPLSTFTNNGTVTIGQAPSLNGFSCNPITISPSVGSTCTVALTSAPGSGGATINLSASSAAANIPSSAIVAQGSTSQIFSVTAGSVATATPVTLTASYAGASETFDITVNPPPAALSAISVSPGTIVSGQSGSGTVTLNAPAPSGGAVVSLTSSNSSVAGVPSSVRVLQGATTAAFTVATSTVSTATHVTFTASYSGVNKTTGITVNPVAALSSVSVSPSTIGSGQSGTGTVTLTSVAPAGGAVVSLSSSNSSAAAVPATVTVPQNLTSVTFTVSAGTVTVSTPVTLTATYASANVAFNLNVNPLPAALSSVSVSPGTIVTGHAGTGTVTLSAAAGSGGVVVALSSSNSSAAGVPAGMTVPQGSTSATFTVSTGSVTVSTPVTVTATYSGVSVTFALTVSPVPAALSSVSVSPGTIVSGQSGTGTVTLNAAAPSGGATVTLSSSNSSAASVPATAKVSQGAKTKTFTVSTGTVSVSTPVTVTATYSGVSVTFNLTVSPVPAVLSSVSVNSGTIVSGQSTTGTVTLSGAAGSGGAVVTLSSSNSSAAGVPASVTVSQGSTSATFTVASGTVSTSTPVTLTATYAGVTKTCALTVKPKPDFSLNASSSAIVAPGSSTTYTVSVTGSNGFSGSVSFGTSGLPSGVTASFNPTTVSGTGSTTMTIRAPANAAPGGTTFTVTGTSGSLTHSDTALLTITGGSPTAVSVTPATGSGASQTFVFKYSDPNGAADITSAQIDISSALSVSGACYLYYPRSVNQIYLASDAGVWQGPLTVGSAGTLQNSQCIVNAGASSASISGNTLTLNLALTFKDAFAGSKNVYMEVQDASHDSGWTKFGTWTVGSVAPPPDFSIAISPGPGTIAAGSTASFMVTVTGNNGFNGAVSFANGALPSGVTGSFNPTSVTGSGTTTLTVQTSSSVSPQGVSISVTGTSGALSDTASTSLTISNPNAGGFATAVSVTPNSGSGPSQTFAFTYTDPKGAADITSTQIDISSSLSVSGACYLYYPRALNQIYLASDAGVWQGPLTVGSSGTLQNSQCSLNAGASSASMSGNTLTLNLALTFTSAFAGTKNVYMEVLSGHDSGWSALGAWTVSNTVQSADPPAPLSVTPNSGSGSSATFSFAFSDGNGAADITTAQMDIASTLSVSGACYLYYARALNQIYVASDAGVWQGPLNIGSAGTLQNSQCIVDVGASSASKSGNILTVDLALTFKAGFTGAKNIYMEVQNTSHDSGWSRMGGWTVQ